MAAGCCYFTTEGFLFHDQVHHLAGHVDLFHDLLAGDGSLDLVIGERRLDTPQGDVFWPLAREAFIPMSTVAVRADAFKSCSGFVEDRDLSGTADWELWLRLAARWPVGFVDRVGTCIRVHERNTQRRCTIGGGSVAQASERKVQMALRTRPTSGADD